MRDSSPVWEIGFSFLVANPDNDTLQLKIIDQKTTNELGKFTFILSHLMEKKNMEILTQPFQLQKSGPESKLFMALSLRILKRGFEIEDITDNDSKPTSPIEEKKNSFPDEPPKPPLRKHESRISTSPSADTAEVVEDNISTISTSPTLASPPSPTSSRGSDKGSSTVGRRPSINSLNDPGHLGTLQLTLQYNVQRQKLHVIVHRIKNIPLKDPSNIPGKFIIDFMGIVSLLSGFFLFQIRTSNYIYCQDAPRTQNERPILLRIIATLFLM